MNPIGRCNRSPAQKRKVLAELRAWADAIVEVGRVAIETDGGFEIEWIRSVEKLPSEGIHQVFGPGPQTTFHLEFVNGPKKLKKKRNSKPAK